MKFNFDNAGVAALQSQVLALHSTALAQEILAVQNSLSNYLIDKFYLTTQQLAQVQSMSPAFITQVTQGITACWTSGVAVQFQKDTRAADDDGSIKDIIVTGPDNPPPNPPTTNVASSTYVYFSIYIRYRFV